VKIDESRSQIEHMHVKLKREFDIKSGPLDFTALEKHLPLSQQNKFRSDFQVEPVYRLAAQLNEAFVPVLEHCLRFKGQLGLCL
jgi:hypothetical protein